MARRCQCGEWSGQACDAKSSETPARCRVAFIPESDRGSAIASGNADGFEVRIWVTRACRDWILAPDEDGIIDRWVRRVGSSGEERRRLGKIANDQVLRSLASVEQW